MKPRATAALAAAVAIAVIAFWWWDTRYAANGPSRGILAVQLLIRAVAAAAALRGWFIAMLGLFAVAFFPIGLYFLGSPSYLVLVGIADLVYLGSAIALWRATRY